MPDLPRITVVTPSYNQAQFLETTLESVLSQGYPNLEYLVIDGGSTDGSVDIIRRHEARLAGWLSERDKGQTDAINKGLRRATGDVFAFLNSDDTYEPGALAAVGEMFRDTDADMVYGMCDYISASGEFIEECRFFESLDLLTVVAEHGLAQPSVFMHKRVCDQTGPFNETMHHSFDYEYWLRALFAGSRLTPIRRLLSHYRLHDASKTVSARKMQDIDVRDSHLWLFDATRRAGRSTSGLRRAMARCYRRFAIENYKYDQDRAAVLKWTRLALSTDAAVFDPRLAKVAVKALLGIGRKIEPVDVPA